MNVRKVVYIHEHTVQKAGKGDHPVYGKRKRKGMTRSKTTSVKTHQAIDPMLVAWMKKHGVQVSEVQILTPKKIIVRKK